MAMEVTLMDAIKPIQAEDVPQQTKKSIYPQPYASMMNGRIKKKLGDFFNLNNYGVNFTELPPGSMSALKHRHSLQDELIYILSGTPTLVYANNEYLMKPGECMGFKAGDGNAHHLVNRSENTVTYLEIGDRSLGDEVVYPDDDICANFEADGTWAFTHKDGTPY